MILKNFVEPDRGLARCSCQLLKAYKIMDRSRQAIRYDERQLEAYQQSFQLAQNNLILSLEEEWFQKYWENFEVSTTE